jgi:hypothetical protein
MPEQAMTPTPKGGGKTFTQAEVDAIIKLIGSSGRRRS